VAHLLKNTPNFELFDLDVEKHTFVIDEKNDYIFWISLSSSNFRAPSKIEFCGIEDFKKLSKGRLKKVRKRSKLAQLCPSQSE